MAQEANEQTASDCPPSCISTATASRHRIAIAPRPQSQNSGESQHLRCGSCPALVYGAEQAQRAPLILEMQGSELQLFQEHSKKGCSVRPSSMGFFPFPLSCQLFFSSHWQLQRLHRFATSEDACARREIGRGWRYEARWNCPRREVDSMAE
jgi:hypothetical protein